MLDNTIEFFFAVGLFVNACLFIPQAYRIIKSKHARDVSLVTFAGFNLINLFTFLHGIIKHDIVLASGVGLSLIFNTLVTLLIIWYRYFKVAEENT